MMSGSVSRPPDIQLRHRLSFLVQYLHKALKFHFYISELYNALWLEHGKLTIGNRAIPKPGLGELLAKVKAAGLNPVDWKIQHGVFPLVFPLPLILGTDIAGDVQEVGEGIANLSKGDRVYVVPVIYSLDLDHLLVCGRFFQGLLDNINSAGFRQYSIADASMTAKVRLFRCSVGGLGLSYWRLQIPAKLSYEDASTIPVALTISYLEVFRTKFGGMQFSAPPEPSQRGQLAGTPVVVLGGSSSVGQYGESVAHFGQGLR